MDNDHIATIVDTVVGFVEQEIENDQSSIEEIAMENEFENDTTEVETVNLNENDDLIEDIISGIIKDSVNLIENIQGTNHDIDNSDLVEQQSCKSDSDIIKVNDKEYENEIIDSIDISEKDTVETIELIDDTNGASELVEPIDVMNNNAEENLEICNTDQPSDKYINENDVIIESEIVIDDESNENKEFDLPLEGNKTEEKDANIVEVMEIMGNENESQYDIDCKENIEVEVLNVDENITDKHSEAHDIKIIETENDLKILKENIEIFDVLLESPSIVTKEEMTNITTDSWEEEVQNLENEHNDESIDNHKERSETCIVLEDTVIGDSYDNFKRESESWEDEVEQQEEKITETVAFIEDTDIHDTDESDIRKNEAEQLEEEITDNFLEATIINNTNETLVKESESWEDEVELLEDGMDKEIIDNKESKSTNENTHNVTFSSDLNTECFIDCVSTKPETIHIKDTENINDTDTYQVDETAIIDTDLNKAIEELLSRPNVIVEIDGNNIKIIAKDSDDHENNVALHDNIQKREKLSEDIKVIEEKIKVIQNIDLDSKINKLHSTDTVQETQIHQLLEECRGIKDYIEEINTSYQSILETRSPCSCKEKTKCTKCCSDAFSREVEALRNITNNTIYTLEHDNFENKDAIQLNTPVLKRKHLMNSPYTKRREIKTLLENHKDCETSDILQEIMNPWYEEKSTENNKKSSEEDMTTIDPIDKSIITNSDEISDMRKRRIVVIDEFDDGDGATDQDGDDEIQVSILYNN